MEEIKGKYIWGLLRLGMGWIFFWAFIDKVFGLGFATATGKGWIDGVSPTFGFLKFAGLENGGRIQDWCKNYRY